MRISRPLQIVAALFCCVGVAQAAPRFDEVRAGYLSSEALVVDRNGEPLYELRIDRNARRLEWVRLEEISPAMLRALVAAEDRRFYEHGGVDWQAFASAALDNLWRSRPRGASTLTMQLAAMLDDKLRAEANGRTLLQKFDQAFAARDLEKSWTKAQILEAYLNLVSFRGELSGIGAASQGLFGKHPSGLNRQEAALLAALVRSPGAKPEIVAGRACQQLDAKWDSGTCIGTRALALATLSGRYTLRPRFDAAPHLAHTLPATPGARIVTTLDARLQRLATEALMRNLVELEGRNVQDGAVLVLDNASGEILAYVASSGELSAAGQVDGITARRQAGSTLKPFLYELAIERRLLTAASLLDDTPLAIPTARGDYVPQNYDRAFKGQVSMRSALAASLNVPAVRTVQLVGVDAFHQRLRDIGFSGLIEGPDYYGPALALGSADVSLMELTNAYRTLANRGIWSLPTAVSGAERSERRVLDPASAAIIADVLSDRGARALTFGLDNPLATRFWTAVKTGTSKDMRDNWTVGFSSRYTVGVWVGNFSGSAMWDVSGVSGAAPIWLQVMSALHAGEPSIAPRLPKEVIRRGVSFDGDIEAARNELFLRGTELEKVVIAGVPRIRITYPVQGAVLAIDPEIPAERQRVLLTRSSSDDAVEWQLDGSPLKERAARIAWPPRPGQHRLALEDATGREIDAITFIVRGGEEVSGVTPVDGQ